MTQNKDVFNKNKIALKEGESAAILEIKEKAEELYAIYSKWVSTRELSIAKTKLEESVMWAVKNVVEWAKAGEPEKEGEK